MDSRCSNKNESRHHSTGRRAGGDWQHMTLEGMRRVDLDQFVCHVSYYEADAFARWSHCRLPTETEWELAAASGNCEFRQRDTHAWQWTGSPYSAYPGYQPFAGSLAEYNGKFHDQSIRVAWRLPCNAQAALANELPKFLPPAPAMDVCGPAPCAWTCDLSQ